MIYITKQEQRELLRVIDKKGKIEKSAYSQSLAEVLCRNRKNCDFLLEFLLSKKDDFKIQVI